MTITKDMTVLMLYTFDTNNLRITKIDVLLGKRSEKCANIANDVDAKQKVKTNKKGPFVDADLAVVERGKIAKS
jgi:hypothetical protein